MKKIATTLLIVCALMTFTFGQISTTTVAAKTDQKNNAPYDSLQNFLGKDVYQYIGQDLYLKGESEKIRPYGYMGFLIDYKKDIYQKGNIYNCCSEESKFNSNYDKMREKYFKVLDVLKHPNYSDFLYSDKYYLKLQEKISGDIVYYEYSSRFKHSFPFIVVGYFEKLKKTIVGNEYILMNKNSYNLGEPVNDINTGKPVDISPTVIWKAKDITIEERYFILSVLLENNNGENIVFDLENINDESFIIKKSVADEYKVSFGTENWELISQGKVKIGMTSKMCEISWGKPKSINETITSGNKNEQWIYSSNYLYFENGILTAMQ